VDLIHRRSHGRGHPANEELTAMNMTLNAEFVETAVHIATGPVPLDGRLAIPDGARAVVLFAHGSGSSRHGPLNRFVAEALYNLGLASLSLNLLTADEEKKDRFTGYLRLDIGMLARRLIDVTDWMARRHETSGLRIGYFGASTGTAAALVAAAERPETVGAIVSRGGRPELAGEAILARVRVPTLLIVGSLDARVLECNRRAKARMAAPVSLEIVPGATHRFDEPGCLEEVARLARRWFDHHLTPAGAARYTACL
jgi:dienelactone hydrolase